MKNQPIKNNDLKERKVVSKSKKKKLVLRKEFIVLFLILFTILGLYSSYNIIRWAIDDENTEKQIEEIHETVDIPLVIHGGTGVKEEDIHKCTNYGVRKFNVGTELLVGWTKKAMEKFATTKENAYLRNNIVPCNEVVYEIVKHKIGIFLNK